MTAPRRYIFHIRRRINQLPDFFRLPLQDAGTFTLPVFTQKIVHRTGAPAATPWMEFNNHHPALFPVRHAATVPDRHRSPSALPRSAPGHDRHHRRSLSGRSGSGYCPCRQADAAAPAKSRKPAGACRFLIKAGLAHPRRQLFSVAPLKQPPMFVFRHPHREHLVAFICQNRLLITPWRTGKPFPVGAGLDKPQARQWFLAGFGAQP